MIIDIRKVRTLMQEPKDFLVYLNGLTNSQFRKLSQQLSDRLLPEMTVDEFWPLFSELFFSDRKAYLGTLLKALCLRLEKSGVVGDSSLAFEKEGVWQLPFALVCQSLTETDRKKVLLSLLPLIDNPADVERLLLQCQLTEAATWIPYLLQSPTAPSYFLLLRALRYVEHDRALLIRTCHYLMKLGDEQSFNMASILRLSFALEEVHGTFSLQLEPYHLSRIEQNYEAFLQHIHF